MELALELIQRAEDERWTHLDLGRCGLTELPDELFELTWLTSLQLCDEYFWFETDTHKTKYVNSKNSVSANNLSTLPKGLANLASLERLVIGGSYQQKWALNDGSVLVQFPSLTHLQVNHTNINQIIGIEALTKLQHLNIANNKFECLGDIDKLPCLELLDCGSNPLVNPSELWNLTQPSHLFAYDLNIETLDAADLSSLGQLIYIATNSRMWRL